MSRDRERQPVDLREPKTTGVEDVVVNIMTRAAMLLSGTAIQSLLAYALLPVGRGEFAVCMLFASLLGVLLTPGADAGAQYFVMAKRISISEGVSTSLLICLLGSGLGTVLAVPLITSEFAFFRKADSESFYLALGLLPLITFGGAVQHQLAGLRSFLRIGLFLLVRTVTNGLALTIFVLWLRLGVDGAILATYVSNLMMIAICLRNLSSSAGLRLKIPSRASLTRILRYGIKYYIGRIGWGGDIQAGTFLLGVLGTRAEVGVFAVASTIMMSMITVSNAVSIALLPRTASVQGGRPDLITFCSRTMVWIAAVVLVLVVAFDVHWVRILLSPEFLPAVPLLRIIAPGVLIYAGASVFATYFRGIGRPDICSWAVLCGFGLTLAIVTLLYRDMGVIAAALGMSGGLLGRSVLLSLVYYRITNTHPTHAWLPRRGDVIRFRKLIGEAINRIRRG